MNKQSHNSEKKRSLWQRVTVVSAAIVTMIAVLVTFALCFDQSKRVSVDIGAGEVTASATSRGALTGDYSAPGKLNNDDYMTYSYTGGVQSITLPIGEYKLEVWGAQGGKGRNAYDIAGKGGYTSAVFKTTNITTIYIVVGGKGNDAPGSSKQSVSGGYNGGGSSKSLRTCSHNGGGGGGATHIATSTGALSTLSGNTGAVLIVAGGGGGAGNSNSTAYYGGGGGGDKTGGYGVVAGGNAGTGSNGGGTTAGGTCSGTRAGKAGSFGQGGAGYSGTSNYVGGAGGGGGYWGAAGGGVPSSCSAYGGGGGSSYVKSTLTSAVYQRGVRTGAGQAQITVINVNQKPVSANKTYSGISRGNGTISVKASEIATDPDVVKTELKFTNGTASNLDTLTRNNSSAGSGATGIYLNSACTTPAVKYLDWTWVNDGEISVTGVKLYPRNGVDGCTSSGRLTLYAKVRDSFGTTVSSRGWNTVVFYIKVSPNAVNRVTTTVTNPDGDRYFIGMSADTDAPTSTASPTEIYNPNGPKRYTLIFERPLRYRSPFTIDASRLLSGDVNGGIFGNDKVVMAMTSTSAITGTNPKYTITEYPSGSETIYNKNKVAVANAYSTLTFVCQTPDPTYQVFQVKLYVVEKSTAYTDGTLNVAPDIEPIDLDIVFKMDNTRPVLKDTEANPPVIELDALVPTDVDLNKYYSDADTTEISSSTHTIKNVIVATREFVLLDKYNKLVDTAVGTNSYFNVLPSGSSLSNGLFEGSDKSAMLAGVPTGFSTDLISPSDKDSAFVRYSFNNATLTLTGLRATYDMYDPNRASGSVLSSKESVYDSVSVKNAGHFYILINLQDKNDAADEGIWLPLGIVVKNTAPTDTSTERGTTGTSEMPYASGARGETFYFTPMGLTVANDRTTYPLGMYMGDNGLTSKDLKALASDTDNFYNQYMINGSPIGLTGTRGVLNELVTLADGQSASAVQSSVDNNMSGEYFTVEPLDIYVPVEYFGGRVKTDATNAVPVTYNGVADTNCVIIQGLKITLNNWTHNRYLYATVKLQDSAADTVVVQIPVFVNNIKPSNKTASDVATLNYVIEGKTVNSRYTVNSGVATIEYNVPSHSNIIITPYDLLTDANITASNINSVAGGFTLNGLSGVYDGTTGTFNVGADAKGDLDTNHLAVTGLAVTDYNTSKYYSNLKSTMSSLQGWSYIGGSWSGNRVFANNTVSSGRLFGSDAESTRTTATDGLFFARTTDNTTLDGYTFNPYASGSDSFSSPYVVGDSFISPVAFGSTINWDGVDYRLDYAIITTVGRTQSGSPITVEFSVRDRTGSGAIGDASGITKFVVRINVINSSPRIQYPDRVYTLTTLPIGPDSATVDDAFNGISVRPSTISFTAAAYSDTKDRNKNFLIDNEVGDTVAFYTGADAEIRVIDENGSTVDSTDQPYLNRYLSVSVTPTTLTVTALNSTQNVQKLYVVFYTTDNRTSLTGAVEYGTSKVCIQVMNANMKINSGDGGFVEDEDKNYRWTIETVSDSDIKRTRYFTSGEEAERLVLSEFSGVSASQVKSLVTDTDGLQGAVLSPMNAVGSANDRNYLNLSGTDYTKAVPDIGLKPAKQSTVRNPQQAVNVYMTDGYNSDHDSVAGIFRKASDVPEGITEFNISSYEIYYFVGGEVYSAYDLINDNTIITEDNAKLFFDGEGRWKVADWAIAVTPADSTSANSFIGVSVNLRDETVFGGDTAGINTAWDAGENVKIDGFNVFNYQLYVNGPGIVPYTYYNQFNGYYVVTDNAPVTDNSGAEVYNTYVPTYDGDDTTTYAADQPTLYLDGNTVSSTAGGTELKPRAANKQDNTLAGRNSGEIYNPTVDYSTHYTGESAFRYTDTIVVADNKAGGVSNNLQASDWTYLPMSYLALNKSLVSVNANGTIVYDTHSYVAYDIPSRATYMLDSIYGQNGKLGISDAITIFDGVHRWTGSNLTDNPYVFLSAYDAETSGDITTDPNWRAATQSPYFNNALSISTHNDKGVTELFASDDAISANAKNLVGKDGRLLYLQDHATKLKENMFGLMIAKKHSRASASTLTITINVASCVYTLNDGSGTQVSYTDDNKDTNTASITLKLELGNSPVSIQAPLESVNANTTTGYYTSLELTTGGAQKSVGLLRYGATNSTAAAANADVKVMYNDGDIYKDEKGNVDYDASDKAYFYSESLYALGTWRTGRDGFERVADYNTDITSLEFSNSLADRNENGTYTADASRVQASIQNYLGGANSRDKVDTIVKNGSPVSDVTFQPNSGAYGSNREGFSDYFTVNFSSDTTMLTISPNAKTTINKEMLDGMSTTQIEAYYKSRGLVYDNGRGYYPLKVLIYDSHGDGFMSASYVALEIRVYITGSAPSLSGNLENDGVTGSGDKQISIALPVTGTYNLGIASVLDSGDLLYDIDNGDKNLYWKHTYDALKRTVDPSVPSKDTFRLETGTYLYSPFSENAAYGWRETTNDDLRNGLAKLTENVSDVSAQNDVIMYMNYTNPDGTQGLNRNSLPDDNYLRIKVNRRTTYDSQSYSDFKFTIIFTDNEGHSTKNLTVNVHVTNQTPYARNDIGTAASQHLRMRVGDSFTVLTTPYNLFIGAEDAAGIIPSASARASSSYKAVVDGQGTVSNPSLTSATGDSNGVKYRDLTTASLATERYALHSYDSAANSGTIAANQHLGYLAMVSDDTPWSLRIEGVSYYDNNCFVLPFYSDGVKEEGSRGQSLYLGATIVAQRVCTNMPVTVTLVDGDMAHVTYTLYVTVVSSRPIAIHSGDNNHPLSEALTPVVSGENELDGVYNMYMIANSESTGHLTNVDVMDGIRPVTLPNVYGKFTININELAYDPDIEDNNNISLYIDRSDRSFHIFTLNGMKMQRQSDGLRYYNDIFNITLASDYSSFTIECLTYNPDSDLDTLRFYIGDHGDDIFNNAIPVEIRISTLYSSMTNDHQSTTDKVTADGRIRTETVDTVNVKAYDDYMGTSAKVLQIIEDEKDLPDEQKTKIVGVDSTYQFLNYVNAPDSVDQTVTGWGINDRDVGNSIYNRNYDVRVYAFMERDIDDTTGTYTPVSLERASEVFNITPSQLQKHYWYLKDDDATAKLMESYFVGGSYATGGTIAGANNSLVMFINRYFVFDFGADGVSLTFRPVTSNIDVNIMFYVELEKSVGSSRRLVPVDVATKAGVLFNVKVQDSAPTVNTDRNVLSFKGKINESHIFTIYDENNPFDALFADSDLGDMVVVNGFVSSGNTSADYAEALKDADCDWQSREGVRRAVEIEINNDDVTVAEIPAHSLRLTIQRRIDKLDEEGNYLSEVTFPLYLTGVDKTGSTVTATLMITVENSDFDVDNDMLNGFADNFDSHGVGYSLTANEGEERSYTIDAYVSPDGSALEVPLVAARWFNDPDFTSMAADTDSFKLVKEENENSHKYIVDAPLEVYPDGEELGANPIAVVTPVFTGNDKFHFTGLSITAASFDRDITATAYMRVLDRSGIATRGDTGVNFTVKVTVLNSAPVVKPGRENTTYTVDGVDNKAGTPIVLDANDFVTDVNGDTLRIVSMLPVTPDSSDIHCTDAGTSDNGGSLLDVALVAGSNEQKMTITPRAGFYGKQDVMIMVADGDLSTDMNARACIFTVTLKIVYTFNQIPSLKSISAVRSIPTAVTTAKLFPDLTDYYDSGVIVDNDPNAGATPSADEGKVFNPGSDYIITSLRTTVSNVDIRQNGNDWEFVCNRDTDSITFDVSFVRAGDYGKEGVQVFNSTFVANIAKNTPPVLNENFRRNGNTYTFRSGGGDYGLDGNGTVVISTDMMFSDVDKPLGDKLEFISSVTGVVSDTLCSVRISEDGSLMYLTFKYRGETDLTVGVKDRTGETHTMKVHIVNNDRPNAPFMDMIKISVETNLFIWIGVAAGILFLIFLIILIILLVKRRKRKQEELEAILVSEMELEEQMLRIANTSNAAYQSFGYLPPTPSQMPPDPGMMLGAGEQAPNTDVLGLNSGNNGVSNDSDM